MDGEVHQDGQKKWYVGQFMEIIDKLEGDKGVLLSH